MKYLILLLSLSCIALAQPASSTGPLLVERDSLGYHCTFWTWDDMRAPANGINPQGAGDAPAVNNTDGSLQFAADKNSDVAILVQMPHNWRAGTDVHVHIHWQKSTTDTGFVRWQMKYAWANIDDAFPATSAFADGYNITALDGSTKHRIFAWAALSGAGKTMSSFLKIVIQRQSNGAPDDTYPSWADLLGIDVHYEACIFGSNLEYQNGQ